MDTLSKKESSITAAAVLCDTASLHIYLIELQLEIAKKPIHFFFRLRRLDNICHIFFFAALMNNENHTNIIKINTSGRLIRYFAFSSLDNTAQTNAINTLPDSPALSICPLRRNKFSEFLNLTVGDPTS